MARFERFKQFADVVLDQKRGAQDSHYLNNGTPQLHFMFQYADKAVGNNGNMDLDADGILGFTPESLDLEMLLDPLVQLLSTEGKP